VGEEAKGVIIRGVDDEFTRVSGLDLRIGEDCMTIGESLSKILRLKNNDQVVLGLITSHKGRMNTPKFFSFKVCSIENLGLFLSDTRYVYVHLKTLQSLLGLDGRVNMIIVNDENREAITVGSDFFIDSTDKDYAFVFHAVEVEKNMLGLILQIIVVVAVFNVIAFIIFLKERYAKEIFYLQALGLSKKKLIGMWSIVILSIVIVSNIISLFMLQGVNYMLRQSFFGLPAKIYHLSSLQVVLTLKDYLAISLLGLFWPSVSALHIFANIYNQSVISGVKREFGL
jgi:ABC-type lipoprotein release transport system permease subunit